MDQKKIVLDFLAAQKYMVLATTTNDIPEAALVGFCEMENLDLVFGTDSTSRKFQNIQNNSRVAIVVGNEKSTLQYEGIVSVLIGDELKTYKEKYFAKLPEVKKYETEPNQIYLKVMLIWLRYTDYSKDSSAVFEIRP